MRYFLIGTNFEKVASLGHFCEKADFFRLENSKNILTYPKSADDHYGRWL